tara:strand:+ start:1817 stop:2092 length:276 start_codon:yes stop_codon:yes gene_type:complete
MFKNIKKGDFVYLDPPYVPENKHSFIGYDSSGFDLKTHELFFNEIKNRTYIHFVMSNSKVKLVDGHFKDYKQDDIIVRRAIQRNLRQKQLR